MHNQIVAVLGDYYHREDRLSEALQSAVREVNRTLAKEANAYELSIVPYTKLTDALSERPKLVVLSKEERLYPEEEHTGNWLHPDLQESAVQYVTSGGAWLAWHSGLAYRTDGPYRRMLRGWFLHHPKPSDVKYEPTSSSEPILTVQDSFSIHDEHYFVHCEEAKTNVFLRSTSADGQSIAGWTHDIGKGRICCLAPAHMKTGLQDASFLRVLASCIRWSLRET